MLEFINDVLVQTILITFFVLAMIMVIEYINVFSQGAANRFMRQHQGMQIIIATVLGLIPGCIGTYTAVSLFTHDVVGFGALIANLIATTGDEAFFMLTLMPQKALIIGAILAVLAITCGYIATFVTKKHKNSCGQENHFEIHHTHDTHTPNLRPSLQGLKHPSTKRIILIVSILAFGVMAATGILHSNHNHGDGVHHEEIVNHEEVVNLETHQEHESEHHHDHHHGTDPVTITFIILAGLSLFVAATVPDHFLEEHIVNHVIKKHFAKIFLWTFAALAAIFVLNKYMDVESFVNGNTLYILIAALAIGLIPESGPHLIFITLYLGGNIPLGILLANCIVQDGHGAIPLFAESKKYFFIAKGIKVILGAGIGLAMM